MIASSARVRGPGGGPHGDSLVMHGLCYVCWCARALASTHACVETGLSAPRLCHFLLWIQTHLMPDCAHRDSTAWLLHACWGPELDPSILSSTHANYMHAHGGHTMCMHACSWGSHHVHFACARLNTTEQRKDSCTRLRTWFHPGALPVAHSKHNVLVRVRACPQ